MQHRQEAKVEYRHKDEYRESFLLRQGLMHASSEAIIAICIIIAALMLLAWMAWNWLVGLVGEAFHSSPVLTIIGAVIAASPIGWIVWWKWKVIIDNHNLYVQRELAEIGALNTSTNILQLNAQKYGFNAEYVRGDLAIRSMDPSTGSTHNHYEIDEEEEDDQNLLPPPRFPEPRDFAQVLETFRPTEQNIFLLDTVNGPFTGPMNEIGHVALASPTGGGKTTTARMVISQVLACGGEMYMVNPNYAPVKLNGNRLEDWRPIAARLKEPPAREFHEIEALFDRFLNLVDDRRRKEQISPKRGKDLYLFIGEWPAIVAKAAEIDMNNKEKNKEKKKDSIIIKLGRLLRESRQYGVHVISEFQDALISTIGGNSGVRENYRTAYYFGGDDRTAKVVLSLADGVKPDNTGLGKMGGAMFRFQSNAAIDGRVPFFSNKALYMLLGWPQDPVRDNVVSDTSEVPDSFLPFVVQTTSESPVRPGVDYVEGLLCPRTEDLDDTVEITDETVDLSAYENAMNWPVDAAEATSHRRMDDIKAELFWLAYKITGNIDESLKQVGVSTRYRAHARRIIAERKETK